MEIFSAQANVKLRQRDETTRFLAGVSLAAMVAGSISMALSQLIGLWAAIGICGVIFTAGASVGGFLGSLFSVPRILARGETPAATPGTTGAPSTAAANEKIARRERLLSSNTNLERISEWLTTMLVGVGLSQIGVLPQKMRLFSDFLAANALVFPRAAGTLSAGVLPAVGPFVLVSGIVTGFLFFYLYTRIYLSPLFQYVEEILSDPGTQELGPSSAEVRNVAQGLVDEGTANPTVTFAASTPNLTVNQALSVISSLLYQPGRFEEAISTGNGLMTTPAAKTAQFWFLMTAALGQRYHAQLWASSGARAEIFKARDAVLAAARETVARDPSYKARLQALTDPEAQDNDLQDLRHDPDFLKIVE